jgi:chromosome segregation ATPase
MGRSGISEYQVFQAADQLLADGIKPSVDTVRQELGNTGSRTTINNYLKAWRERQAQREHAGVNLGEHLLGVLREQSAVILSAIESAAQAKFQAKTQSYQVELDKQRQRVAEQETEITRYQSEIKDANIIRLQQLNSLQQQQAQLADAHEELQSLRERLAKETGRRETLEGAINERDRQLNSLQREVKVIQSRNEILTESHANKTAELHQFQQRDREQRVVLSQKNAEIKRLTLELKGSKQQRDKELSQLMISVKQLAGAQQTRNPSKRNASAKAAQM